MVHFQGTKAIHIERDMRKEWNELFGNRSAMQKKIC